MKYSWSKPSLDPPPPPYIRRWSYRMLNLRFQISNRCWRWPTGHEWTVPGTPCRVGHNGESRRGKDQSLSSGDGGYSRFKRDLSSSRPSAPNELRTTVTSYPTASGRLHTTVSADATQLRSTGKTTFRLPRTCSRTTKVACDYVQAHTLKRGRRYLQITILLLLLLLLIRRLQKDTPTCADVNVSRRASNGERQYRRRIMKYCASACVRSEGV